MKNETVDKQYRRYRTKKKLYLFYNYCKGFTITIYTLRRAIDNLLLSKVYTASQYSFFFIDDITYDNRIINIRDENILIYLFFFFFHIPLIYSCRIIISTQAIFSHFSIIFCMTFFFMIQVEVDRSSNFQVFL